MRLQISPMVVHFMSSFGLSNIAYVIYVYEIFNLNMLKAFFLLCRLLICVHILHPRGEGGKLEREKEKEKVWKKR